MSNVPYQMVYSNCQNKGWSVSNFPENLLRNSSSRKVAVTSHEFIYYSVIPENLGKNNFFFSQSAWWNISREREGDRSCKLARLKSQKSTPCLGLCTQWNDWGQSCDLEDDISLRRMAIGYHSTSQQNLWNQALALAEGKVEGGTPRVGPEHIGTTA